MEDSGFNLHRHQRNRTAGFEHEKNKISGAALHKNRVAGVKDLSTDFIVLI